MKFIKQLINKIGQCYCNFINKREFEFKKFKKINERPIEYRFVFESLTNLYPKTVLDVGTGITALPRLIRNCGFVVTAIDNIKDYWPRGMFNRHYYVIDDDITRTNLNNKFDFICCISTLEHILNFDAAAESMFKLLHTGGHLVITFPYNENEHIDNVYKLSDAGYGKNAPYICHVFSRDEIDSWLKKYGGEIIKQEYWQFFSGDFWTMGERLQHPRQVEKSNKHQLSCLLIKKK